MDFEVIIPDEKQDKNLAKRIISKELSGIFNWVLEGLDRLLKQQQFTESPKAKSLLEEMRLESDSVAQFMAARQYIPSVSEEDKILLKDFRDDYKMYCIEQQILSVSQKEFSSRIKSLKFNIVKGGGGNNYTYVKRNDIAAEFAANSLNNKL